MKRRKRTRKEKERKSEGEKMPYLLIYEILFIRSGKMRKIVSSHSTEVVHQIVALITQVRFLV